jgi:hypothetical protein
VIGDGARRDRVRCDERKVPVRQARGPLLAAVRGKQR